MELATHSSATFHYGSLADGLPVLGLSFLLPDAKSLCTYRRTVLEELLGRIVAVNLHAPGSMSSL